MLETVQTTSYDLASIFQLDNSDVCVCKDALHRVGTLVDQPKTVLRVVDQGLSVGDEHEARKHQNLGTVERIHSTEGVMRGLQKLLTQAMYDMRILAFLFSTVASRSA